MAETKALQHKRQITPPNIIFVSQLSYQPHDFLTLWVGNIKPTMGLGILPVAPKDHLSQKYIRGQGKNCLPG